MNPDTLTPWGEAASLSLPLPEHPRPQFFRPSWQNLNGCWDYEINDGSFPDAFSDHILVPFSPESVLSGAKRSPKQGETAWYQRGLTIPKHFFKERLLLHFEAVDAECHVYLNRIEVGQHSGAYDSFTVDITDYASPDWRNTLTVSVKDAYEGGCCTYGKQSSEPDGIWYHGQSGIWQTVWLESIPKGHIETMRLTPDAENAVITLEIPNGEGVLYAIVENGNRIASGTLGKSGTAEIAIPNPKLWTPEEPFLYDLFLNREDDVIKSYFAMRSVRRSGTSLLLNGTPLKAAGRLDQGYWPDGLYTAPADDALIYDIQTAKDMGFNLLRKHVKVESMRWYYHCDRLGMLVIQDIPNGGEAYPKLWTRDLPLALGIQLSDKHSRLFGAGSLQRRQQFRQEALSILDTHYNCPCIIAWSLFNEGWGQFDTVTLTDALRQADGSRLIDSASGWHDQGGGDFHSRHVYFKSLRIRADQRIQAITECGGFGISPKRDKSLFAYRNARDAQEFSALMERFYQKELTPLRDTLSLFVYTQLSDVEHEKNGLLSANRRTKKVDSELLSRLNTLWKNGKERIDNA